MQQSWNATRARALRGVAAVTLAICATVVMTWPLAAGMGRLGRTTSGDGQYATWNVAWVAHALTTAPWELFHANIFYPHRFTLAYSEANIVAGVVGLPAWLLTKNPHAAHNSATLFAFTTSLLGTWALARYVSGSSGGAAVAAATFAFAPYFFAHTAHIQLLFAGGIPLSLLMLHRLVDAPTLAGGLRLGLTLPLAAARVLDGARAGGSDLRPLRRAVLRSIPRGTARKRVRALAR
jgi:hypothetical protein